MGEESGVLKSMCDALGEVQYDVVKINNLGRKQKRLLRFTATGIQNVKNGNVVTKQFCYNDVASVRLTGVDELVIAYDTDHDFVYRSNDAVVIVRELNRRLHLRQCRAFQQIATEFQRAAAGEQPTSSGDAISLFVDPSLGVESPLPAHSVRDQLATLVTRWVYQRDSAEGRTIAHFVRNFGPKSTVPSVRVFLDGMSHHILEHRRQQLLDLANDALGEDEIRLVVDEVLQDAVLVPIWDQVATRMRNDNMTKKENVITVKCLGLRSMHQLGFGIERELLSPTNWAIVVRQFQEVGKGRTPSQMMHHLLQATRSIYRLYKLEHPPKDGKEKLMGADQFLPIFIFVVAQACLQRPVFVTEVLWLLSPPQVLAGEAGYYLTVFQSALEYLVRADVEALLRESEILVDGLEGPCVGLPKLSLAQTHCHNSLALKGGAAVGLALLAVPAALASVIRDRAAPCNTGLPILNRLGQFLPSVPLVGKEKTGARDSPSDPIKPAGKPCEPSSPRPPLTRSRSLPSMLTLPFVRAESGLLAVARKVGLPPKFTNGVPAGDSGGPVLSLPHRPYSFAAHQSPNVGDD